MKPILTSLLLLLSFSLFSQTDLGIGIVSINFDSNTEMNFYQNTTDKNPSKTLRFFDDPEINSWNICDLEHQKDWLQPESLWLDYHSFNFRVVEKNADWYKVIVNNETGKIMWLENSEITDFHNWEEYLRNMFSISRLPQTDQKILKSPISDAPEIPYQGQDCFQVKNMKGEWIEIFTPEHCEEFTDSNSKIKSGWISWRKDNELIIEYFITS